MSDHSPVDISKKCFAQMLNTVRSGLNLLLILLQISKQIVEAISSKLLLGVVLLYIAVYA